MTIDDFLDFARYGDRTAFVEQTPYRSQKTSYREMAAGIGVAVEMLHANGVGAGDRVILWAENSARWAMHFYACLKLRAVVVPIDAGFSELFVEKVRLKTGAKFTWRDEQAPFSSPTYAPAAAAPTDPSDLLEIIYTSGTTGDPKGVMITHGNLLSNLEPVRKEVQKYRKYTFPFSQLGFVHVIPLSHLFGQIMGLFIPQMLGGKVIFTNPSPAGIVQAVKKNKASAVICVPHELMLLRTYMTGRHPGSRETVESGDGLPGVARKWWRHRDVHRELGWKFWAFICGGASLPQTIEQFWGDLGYAVIQGYGLTETAPSVTITHPFGGIKKGSVGKKLPGLEVRIATDGEILVRGPNVSPGYYGDEKATREMIHDGWLHTGDLGSFDDAGNLSILGRKKDVIVTANGLNVYPQDVESVLEQDSRVREAAVVPSESAQGAETHAVLVLSQSAPQSEAADVVRAANAKLESYQQIQSFHIWPGSQLPRTTTGKLMRAAITRGIPTSAMKDRQREDVVGRILSGGAEGERLDEDLGLTSLDRVELAMELEKRAGVSVDDTALAAARTVGDMAALVRYGAAANKGKIQQQRRWHSRRVTEWLRIASWYLLVFPAMALRLKVYAHGVDALKDTPLPVLFVANHQSILDVPAILKALPARLRRRLAPAMGEGRSPWEMRLAAFFFHTYPLPGTTAGLREAIQYTGELADRGYCPLVFPEGARTPDGKLLPFRPGIGVIAKQTKLPVVPIRIQGAFEAWPLQARGPKKGTITVTFGPVMDLLHCEPAEIVSRLEAWYREAGTESHQ